MYSFLPTPLTSSGNHIDDAEYFDLLISHHLPPLPRGHPLLPDWLYQSTDQPTGLLLFVILQMSSRPFFPNLAWLYLDTLCPVSKWKFSISSAPEWEKEGTSTIKNFRSSTFGRLSIYSAIRHRLQLNGISSRAAGQCRFPIFCCRCNDNVESIKPFPYYVPPPPPSIYPFAEIQKETASEQRNEAQ